MQFIKRDEELRELRLRQCCISPRRCRPDPPFSLPLPRTEHR